MARDRAQGINRLGYDNRLVVDHVSVEKLISLHFEHVRPKSDFIEIAARATAIDHQFLDGIESVEPEFVFHQQDA